MADGTIKIDLEVDSKNAKSQAKSTGDAIGKQVASGTQSATKGTGSKVGDSISKGIKSSTKGTGDAVGSQIGGGLKSSLSNAASQASSALSGSFSRASGVASSALGTIGSAAATMGAAVAGVAVAAGVGVAAIGKQALDAYASFEQLEGGVKKLFGDEAAKTVQEYAANAFETAGMSANQYMETATGFSGALLRSLGNDTQAAAEMANMAISDMSDIANTYGMSIDMVKETYQSLARGNYQTLDNLFGGMFAGTKTGIRDMLDYAEQYRASLGETVSYSESSYADIVAAIHDVSMATGVYGTTQAEAAKTIQGSVNMAKAAWENWLIGLGNTDADIGQLTDQLVDSVIVAASNIIPRVGIILSTLTETIASKAPEIAQKLKDGLIASLPESIREPVENAINTIVDVLGRIQTILEPVISTIQTILVGLFESLGSLGSTWSVTIEPAFALAETLFQAVANVMQHLADQASAVLMPAIEALAPTVASFLEAIQPWIEPLTNVANLVGNILVAAITAVIDIINFLIQVITAVLNAFMDFSNFLEGQPSVFGDFVNQIGAWFSQLPGMIGGFLQSVIASIVAWASDMLNQAVTAGTNFLNGVVQTFNDVVAWFTGLPGMILGAIGDLGSLLWNAGSSIIDGLLGGLQEAWGGVAGWFADITSSIPDLKGPAPVDAKLLIDNGKLIMQGLGRGLDDGWSDIEQQLSGYTNSIPVTFDAGGTARALTQGMMQRFDAYKVRQTVSLDSDSSKALGNVSGIISNRFDDIKSLASRPVVLNVNGRELAYTTQADYDSVLGKRQNIEIRGFARA